MINKEVDVEISVTNPFKKVSLVMDQKKALGKGLSSLIPGGGRSEAQGHRLLEIPLSDVVTNPNQPRKLFSKSALDELAQSLEEKGILQPLVVRHLGGGKYELVAGERRFRAAKQIGMETVPVVVKNIEDNEVLELALIENIQRENLNPIEEALAYRDLLSKFQYTQDELAKRLGKDRSSIANALRLLKLPESIRNHLINNELSMGHARALLAVEDRDLQVQIAGDTIANHLSVREVEAFIKRLKEKDGDENDQVVASTGSDEEETTEKTRARKLISDFLGQLQHKLRDRLQTFVDVKGDRNRGKVVISYNSADDLNRLTQKLMEG